LTGLASSAVFLQLLSLIFKRSEHPMKKLVAIALAATAALAHAQGFPGSKPVTLVVPFAAGGPTDRVARDLGEAMRWGTANSASVLSYVGPQEGLLTGAPMKKYLTRFKAIQPKPLA
jgi:hypothetical protein